MAKEIAIVGLNEIKRNKNLAPKKGQKNHPSRGAYFKKIPNQISNIPALITMKTG
ncbi:hypothetical protein [Marinomonas posidonica]|uniref:hypothetical protein n=1 Tax=Marinomonas posidonica TaxID=936476 RepID=UPI0037356062